jgi:deoxycytidylate deaminase
VRTRDRLRIRDGDILARGYTALPSARSRCSEHRGRADDAFEFVSRLVAAEAMRRGHAVLM